MRNKGRKIFFGILILMSIALIGIAIFKRPKKTKLSAILYPYNLVSKVENSDIIDIKLLINNKKSYFLSKDKITNAYLSGIEGKLKLIPSNISLSDVTMKIKGDDYYLVHYYFKIDANIESNYELYLSKAYLYMNFSDTLSTNIHIGSFSYYKYEESIDKIGITSLKAINEKDGQSGFFGCLIGLRNITNSDININNIKILDENIKNIKYQIIDEIKDSTKYEDYDSAYYETNLTLNKNSILYIMLSFDSSSALMMPVEEAGIMVDTNVGKYIIENFVFYKQNILNIKDYNFTIYEYD